MSISIDWANKIINIPKADTLLIQSSPQEIRELDINQFRLDLKKLEAEVVDAGSGGMAFEDTHRHNTEVSVGGVTLARVVEIINGYTVTFEDGQYAVNLTGANSNIADITNVNQVSVRSSNSAGLVSLEAIKANTDNIPTIISSIISDELIVDSGSTSSNIKTNATKADGFYNDMTVIILNSLGTVSRRVNSYANTEGLFVVDSLPFTPDTGDLVIVVNRVLNDSSSLTTTGIATAVWNRSLSTAMSGSFGEAIYNLSGLVAGKVTIIAGSTTTEVRTTATQSDNFYNNMLLVVKNSSGILARSIKSYSNTNGAFTISELPFVPFANDEAIIINQSELITFISNNASLIPAIL